MRKALGAVLWEAKLTRSRRHGAAQRLARCPRTAHEAWLADGAAPPRPGKPPLRGQGCRQPRALSLLRARLERTEPSVTIGAGCRRRSPQTHPRPNQGSWASMKGSETAVSSEELRWQLPRRRGPRRTRRENGPRLGTGYRVPAAHPPGGRAAPPPRVARRRKPPGSVLPSAQRKTERGSELVPKPLSAKAQKVLSEQEALQTTAGPLLQPLTSSRGSTRPPRPRTKQDADEPLIPSETNGTSLQAVRTPLGLPLSLCPGRALRHCCRRGGASGAPGLPHPTFRGPAGALIPVSLIGEPRNPPESTRLHMRRQETFQNCSQNSDRETKQNKARSVVSHRRPFPFRELSLQGSQPPPSAPTLSPSHSHRGATQKAPPGRGCPPQSQPSAPHRRLGLRQCLVNQEGSFHGSL